MKSNKNDSYRGIDYFVVQDIRTEEYIAATVGKENFIQKFAIGKTKRKVISEIEKSISEEMSKKYEYAPGA